MGEKSSNTGFLEVWE